MKTVYAVIATAGCLCGAFALAADSAVILMYHRFGDDRFPSTNIRTGQFEAHLAYLDDNGYTVIPLERLMKSLENDEALPEKAVVITIDDAYRSVYEVGHPILRHHGFPYTVFVSTDGVDDELADFMTWDQMREMQAEGASFANHGASHGSLIDRSQSRGTHFEWVENDIAKAERRLADELSPLEGVFAYPYGEYSTAVQHRLKDMGYRFALGQHSGPTGRLSDPLAMPRFPMNERYGVMDEFRTKVATLPLPVERVTPADPEVETRRPSIRVTLAADGESLSRIACFVGGQGRVAVHWQSPGRSFLVGPSEPLLPGRSRVNCTAPAGDGRFYWFSHPWFVIDAAR